MMLTLPQDPYTQPSRKEFRWDINITPSEIEGKLEVIVATKKVAVQNNDERRTSFLSQEQQNDMYECSLEEAVELIRGIVEELESRRVLENLNIESKEIN